MDRIADRPKYFEKDESMKVKDLMTCGLVAVRSDATIKEAAVEMKQARIGSLPVVEGQTLKGIVTDRDLVVNALASGLDPEKVLVSEVMSCNPVCCHYEDSLERVAELMDRHGIRRVVVINHNEIPLGIVSVDDLAAFKFEQGMLGKIINQSSYHRNAHKRHMS